jgi:hypothetical protein
MTDVNDTLAEAEKTAARLLAQWPDTDLHNNEQIIERCLEFDVDLQPSHGCPYGLDNVRRAGLELQLLASISMDAYELTELHNYAQKLYAPELKIDEQSHKFLAAQAVYRLTAMVTSHGDKSQSQNTFRRPTQQSDQRGYRTRRYAGRE